MFMFSLSLNKAFPDVAGGRSWHLGGPKGAQNDPLSTPDKSFVIHFSPTARYTTRIYFQEFQVTEHNFWSTIKVEVARERERKLLIENSATQESRCMHAMHNSEPRKTAKKNFYLAKKERLKGFF